MSVDFEALQTTLIAALRTGNETGARAVVQQAQQSGLDTTAIYFNLFAPTMRMIGELWERNELTIAQEHLATAMTERLIGQLGGANWGTMQGPTCGVAVMGCVAGERHALGLRMLADLFRQARWSVLYLGADVPTRDWIKLAREVRPTLHVIAASHPQLLPEVATLIAELREVVPQARVLVGGTAFDHTPNAAQHVGADLYHHDPRSAVLLATPSASMQHDAIAATP